MKGLSIRPRYDPRSRNRYPAIGGMGPRPQYTEKPGRVEAMLDAPDRMQGIVKAKQQGPKKDANRQAMQV